MSNEDRINDYYRTAQDLWRSKEYLRAAVSAYWCRMYCLHGEHCTLTAEELNKYSSEATDIYFKSLKMLPSAHLSKSMYVMGSQCEKALWLHKNKYSERRVSAVTQEKFDRGHTIGELAQRLFPDGVDVSEYALSERMIDNSSLSLPFSLKQNIWLEDTGKAMRQDNAIYEAAFTHNGVFAAVDILEKTEAGYVAYEVKSTSVITDTYIKDSALQYYVISHNVKLEDFVLVHLDDEYVRSLDVPLGQLNMNNCDINRLFVKTSVLEKILSMQDEIKEGVVRFKKVLKSTSEPGIKPGEQCRNPYECVFMDYCSRTK